MTKSKPDTEHEKWFVKKYGEFISSTLAKLREPPDPSRPRDVWATLTHLQTSLAHKTLKKNQLKMGEISGALHALKHTAVPLPGNLNHAPHSVSYSLNSIVTERKQTDMAWLAFSPNVIRSNIVK